MICKRRKGNCSSTRKLCVMIFGGLKLSRFTRLQIDKCAVGPLLARANDIYLSVEFIKAYVRNKNQDARDKKRRKIFKFTRNTLWCLKNRAKSLFNLRYAKNLNVEIRGRIIIIQRNNIFEASLCWNNQFLYLSFVQTSHFFGEIIFLQNKILQSECKNNV